MSYTLPSNASSFIAGTSLVLWIGSFCLLGKLHAHPDTQIQIDQTTVALAKPGANPELFLSRAYLHLEHEDFTSALADYRAFAKVQPESPAGTAGEAKVLFYSGKKDEAKAVLEKHLTRFPKDAVAHLLLADVATAQDRTPDAIASVQAAINVRSAPLSCDYSKLIRLQSTLPDSGLSTARATLKQALTLFPNQSELLDLQLSLAEQSQDWDVALATLDQQMAPLKRKEVPLARKAALLEKAHRPAAAAATYQQCLAAIAALPDFLRPQEHVQKVAAEATAALARLASGK